MTAKQIKFCNEYLIDFNATQAAIRAGYKKKSAYVIGYENLNKPQIKAFIAKKTNDIEKYTGITKERVVRELARIAFFDPRKLFDENGSLLNIIDLDEDTSAVLAGLDVSKIYRKNGKGEIPTEEVLKKVKHVDKKGALELLGKHLGLFDDSLQVNVTFEQWLAQVQKHTTDNGNGQEQNKQEIYGI